MTMTDDHTKDRIALWAEVVYAKDVAPGDTVRVELPFSEVCMHLRVAGTVREILVLDTMTQILAEDGVSPFSFPIGHGEAGIYRQADHLYTYVTELVYIADAVARLRRLNLAMAEAFKSETWERHATIRRSYHRLTLAYYGN